MILKNNLLNVDLCMEKSEAYIGQRIADLGCGRSGFFSFPLAEIVGDHGKVYAVDVVKTVIEDIKKRAREEQKRQIHGLWGNIESLNSVDLESGSVDLVLIVNTMHQLEKHINAVREANRILKEKGRLVIIDWKRVANGFGPIYDRRLDQDHIMDMAYRAGMDFHEEFEAGDFHYGLIFHKV